MTSQQQHTKRKIILAVDESECSLFAVRWAIGNAIIRPDDEVHLIACQAVITTGISPAAPLATAGAIAGLTASYHEAMKAEEQRCKTLLRHVKKDCGLKERPNVHTHALPAAGGASGVAESITIWANKEHADLVIVGSRGMGAAKSTLMSLVGLGSVSSYLLHHLHTAIAVVHGSSNLGQKKDVKRVMVGVDESEMAQHAQQWAIENVLGPKDELHIVSVAMPVSYVAGVQSPFSEAHAEAGDFEAEYRGALDHAERIAMSCLHTALTSEKMAADDAAAAHVLESEEEERAAKNNLDIARKIAMGATEAALAAKVDKDRVFFKILEPEGGASDVGLSLKHYAEANDVDVVVVGSRGMGAVKRMLYSVVGLGSVSDWVAANVKECPVVVVKQEDVKKTAADVGTPSLMVERV